MSQVRVVPSGTSDRPARCSAETCRNASGPPSARVTNPKPFCALNHFTVAITPARSTAVASATGRRGGPAGPSRPTARGGQPLSGGDREGVGEGKVGAGRVDLGGGR